MPSGQRLLLRGPPARRDFVRAKICCKFIPGMRSSSTASDSQTDADAHRAPKKSKLQANRGALAIVLFVSARCVRRHTGIFTARLDQIALD